MLRVSTIIPCHNDARWVGRAIESALAQTYRDHEVIVVDDGSTDETPEVLDRYAERIRIVRQPNRGLPAARNLGIAEASGAYVAFLDADDRFLPDKLNRQVARLEGAPDAGMAYCDVRLVTVHGRWAGWHRPRRFPAEAYLAPLFLMHTVIHPSTVVVRRAVIEAVGGFDESLRVFEDWEWYMRVAARYPIVEVREALVVRTLRPGGLSRRADVFPGALREVTAKVVHLGPDLAALAPRREVRIALATGWMHLSRWEIEAGRAWVRRALALDPWNLEARALLVQAWARRAVVRLGLRTAPASPGPR